MPLGKIRGLGGKLGAELSALVAAHSTDAPPTAGASNTGGTSAGGLGAAGGGGGGGALAAAPPPATAGAMCVLGPGDERATCVLQDLRRTV